MRVSIANSFWIRHAKRIFVQKSAVVSDVFDNQHFGFSCWFKSPRSEAKLPFMKRKSFSEMECPIAQTLEVVGEWWTPLLLREVLIHERTKFDEIQKALGIAPTVLANRLNTLVSHGLLERSRYTNNPERFEYVPTASARDFRPVLDELARWGRKWTKSSEERSSS
ncbi:MAG: hypothetical protein CL458_11740 [Acidimicrobiaceae bacterium]|nr:hypothetical protein [Acidimicrobiaceae bacterium]